MPGTRKYRTGRQTQIGYRTYSPSGSSTINPNKTWASLSEVLDSAGHPIPKNGEPWRGDIGGPFYHTKFSIDSRADGVDITHPIGVGNPLLWGQRLQGEAHLRDPTGLQSLALNSSNSEYSDSELQGLGTTAIAAVEPTHPLTSLASTLGELRRDGLPNRPNPHVWRERTQTAKAAGHEYLNVEFGWKPLLADIKSTAKAVVESKRQIDQYRHDAGKLLHRSYEFPDEAVTNFSGLFQANVSPTGPTNPWGTTFGTPVGNIFRTCVTYKRRWFRGAFVYHLNLGTSQKDKLKYQYQQAQHLLGINPVTPDVIWELTPWSWAIDWFTNTGDIMNNLRAFVFDGLVMPYGYMMGEHRTVDDYDWRSHTPAIDGSNYSCSVSILRLSQKRVQATPFGFGLNWDGFSPKQLAILAAVGITRGGKVAY